MVKSYVALSLYITLLYKSAERKDSLVHLAGTTTLIMLTYKMIND